MVLGEASKLQCVDKFCYLGDMIGCSGGAGDAVRSIVRCAWGLCRKLAPILMRMMVGWMCVMSLRDRKTLLELLDRLAIVGVEERVRRCRPRWFGRVEHKRAVDLVSKCRQLEVEGLRGRGRSRKTWMECVDDDMGRLNLRKEDAQDRVVWRNGGPSNPYKHGNKVVKS